MKKGDMNIPQHKAGNMAENSMGGTELLTIELFKRLPDEYKDYFQFIVSRVNKAELEEKPRLYWIHDLALDPVHDFLTKPDGINLFEKLIFVSHWQQQQFNAFLQIPYSKGMVIKNAIDPIPYHQKIEGPLQLIYCSTPQRGLDVLINALDLIERDDFHVHVYSSYKLYGWEKNDEPFKPLFERIENDPRMTYYGAVPYDELREIWKKMHILAYPSTWQETSCRVAMEAMSAHCAVVTSNFGALPETCGEYGYMYTYSENKADHSEYFADMLEDVMDDYWSEKTQKTLDNAQDYAYNHYSWEKRIGQWTDFLDNLKYEIEHGKSEEESGSTKSNS